MKIWIVVRIETAWRWDVEQDFATLVAVYPDQLTAAVGLAEAYDREPRGRFEYLQAWLGEPVEFDLN